jgi:signal transduction histidine kinase
LNAILGWTQLARAAKSNEALISRALETIERNTLIQAKLIEDLLDVSRILTGKLKVDKAPSKLRLSSRHPWMPRVRTPEPNP